MYLVNILKIKWTKAFLQNLYINDLEYILFLKNDFYVYAIPFHRFHMEAMLRKAKLEKLFIYYEEY